MNSMKIEIRLLLYVAWVACLLKIQSAVPARAEDDPTTRDVARPSIETPLPTPGMGWSTYNFFLARHGDKLLREMGDAFVASGLRDAGYTTLRIDGGWWGNDSDRRWWYWTETGNYEGGQPYQPGDPHVDPKSYAGGIRPLADYLHGKGLKLGFYLSPEISTGSADNYPQNNRDHKVPPPVTGLRLIDQHAAWAADSGVDHLFFDGYDWNEAKGTEPYTRMFRSLRTQATRVNRPIAFSINSGWKARPRDWADEWRTSGDINGEWPRIMENLASVADPGLAGKGRWGNPDYLMVGFVGDEEAKSQMSVWCVAGAPLYLSHDFRALNEWDRYVLLNTEAIAVDQDPAGTPGRRVRVEGDAQVWARELSDGSRAVVLLNAGANPLTVGVKWSDLGLPPGAARVRDLWAHKDAGAVREGYTAVDLPPHGCAMLKVRAGDEPMLWPKEGWATHPGRRPSFTPLDPKGWSVRTTMPRKDDPPANLLDGNPNSEFWSYAASGQYVEIDFGKPLRLNRVVIDHKGDGANPWPYKVYAPRSTFTLEVSEDGKAFRKVAGDSFGPSYTVASFEPVAARCLRLVMGDVERTSAYDDPTFHAKDIYVFSTRP